MLGANAATTASGEQTQAEQQAIAEQQREFNVTQQNEQPFISAGQTSIGQLMSGVQNGTFGTPTAAPQYTGGTFQLPTAQQAEQTPGYEFTLQQGEKANAEAASAAGGAVSGGTLEAADQYAQNLASTQYQNTVANALTSYNAGLSQYQAQLAGYGAQLTGQQQAENQLLAPAQIGAGSTATLATAGSNAATNIGNLMTGIGNAQAAGTVGSTNAVTSSLSNATSSLTQAALLQKLLGGTGVGPSLGNTTIPSFEQDPNAILSPVTGSGGS